MLDIRELLNLKEAYAEVYASQELTEEQVWEEVETWVNSLIEEGYDLSDYTWEEMYESYLEEQGGQRGSGSSASQTNQSVRIPGGRTATRVVSDLGSSLAASTKVPTSSGPRNVRGGGQTKPTAAPAASAPAKPAAPVATPAAAKLAPTATRPAASTPARPAAGAPARPTATAAPKPAAATTPAAAKPATGMLGKTSFERRTPTSAELKAAQASRAGGEKNPEKVLQAAKAASTPAPSPARTGFGVSAAPIAAKASVGSATGSSTTPKPTPAATGSKKPGSIVSGFDMFDVVKGYLIGEGYADTEEAALAIMTNMSEEWKQSIIVEAQVANRNPDEYERKAKQGQSREQQLKGRVMGRMNQMDPEKRKKMLAQMRAVGLDV